MDNTKNCMHIKMLNGFEMSMNNITLTDETLRSNMMLKLLVYILCNRRTAISVSEFSDTLWREDESDNPVGALKNLMYRLRNIMQEHFGRKDFIKTLRGSYAWNLLIDVTIDAEEMESFYKAARIELDNEKRRRLLEQAIQLYAGAFLPKFSGEHWIIQLSSYYLSIYITCVKELGSLYEDVLAYEKMEMLCIEALKHEELDESIHGMLMKALMYQGKKAMAEEHYKFTCDLLYSQLGTKPSEEMQKLHQILLKEINNEQMDLSIIQDDLRTVKKEKGAYFCDYGIFKEIYSLQARQAKRLGIAVYCGLITIESTLRLPLNSEAYRKFKDQTMANLQRVLVKTLREGDVVARYSATQFMLLLPTCDYEGGLIVIERIKSNYYLLDNRHLANLIWDLKEQELVS